MTGREGSQGDRTDGPSDAALVQQARAGDRLARSALFERHWDLAFSLCVRTLGDTDLAHDAAQEACVQALVSLDRLRQAESFGPWLAGIGLNVCRAWLRYRHQDAWSWDALVGGRLVAEPLDWRPDPAEQAELADLSTRVCRAVADLPEGQRSAVLLFYLAGHTYAEVAAQLDIQVSAVKTRLHKARTTLRRELVQVWEESMVAHEAQPNTDDQAVEMRIVDVRRIRANSERSSGYRVVLQEVGGTRNFIVGVGGFEGTSIAMLMEKAETARPLTHAFMASVLEASGGTLRQVRITRLEEDTIYAVAVIDGPAGLHEIDARPSDAMALALIQGAPILVEPAAIAGADRGIQERLGLTNEQQVPRLREISVGSLMVVAEVRRWMTSQAGRKQADSDLHERAAAWKPDEHLPLFNDRARRILDLAKEEAVSFGHHYIGTEHLLLGILGEDESGAALFLTSSGVDLGEARATLIEQVGRGDKPVTGEIALTLRAQGALALAVGEARKRGYERVSPEHLLHGIAGEKLGLAALILIRLGVDPERLQQHDLTPESQAS